MRVEKDLIIPDTMVKHIAKIFDGEYNVNYAHPSPVILDIGANIGGFSRWATHRWAGCEIHCYEPIKRNFSKK